MATMSVVRTGTARTVVVAIASSLALLVAACSSGSSKPPASTRAATTAAASSAASTVKDGGVIKIGFVASQSGQFSTFGIPSYKSTQLALQQINQAGGVVVNGARYTFAIDSCETNSVDTGASSCATELVKDHGDKFVFGGIATQAPVVMRIADPAKAIFFSSAGAAAAYLDQTKYMIATLGSNQWRGEAEPLAIHQLFPNAKTMGVVAIDDASIQADAPYLASGAAKYGLTITSTVKVPTGTTDFSSALTSLKSKNPDVLFIFSNSPQMSAQVIRQASELNVAPSIFGHSVACSEAQTDKVDRPFVGNPFVGANLDTPTDPKAIKLLADYKQFTGDQNPANIYSILWNWDYYFMLAKAMEAAGSVTDTDAIMKSLNTITYDGVIGSLKISSDRAGLFGFEMCSLAKDQTSSITYTRVGPPSS